MTTPELTRIRDRHIAKVLSVMELKGLLTPQVRATIIRSYRYAFEDVEEVFNKIRKE